MSHPCKLDDPTMFTGCHRFDQSMVNLLMMNWKSFDRTKVKLQQSKWFQYKPVTLERGSVLGTKDSLEVC